MSENRGFGKITGLLNVNIILRFIIMNAGFSFIALGIVLIINSTLGANPWNVFHAGLTNVLPLTLGQSIQVTTAALILFNLFFREYPGIATFLEALVVGTLTDMLIKIPLLSVKGNQLISILYLLVGTISLGFGVALYIKARMGRAARDGLMFVLDRLLPWRLSMVRTGLEVLVLILGYLLGGPVGIGTIFVAFCLGWVIEYSLKWLKGLAV